MINYTTMRLFARRYFPEPVQKILSGLVGLECKWKGVYIAPLKKRYYASQTYERSRKSRLAALRRKDVISVVFPIESMPRWKADSLLRLMKAHPRFNPVIRLMTPYSKTEDAETDRERITTYAAQVGVPCLEFPSYQMLPEGCAADIVFIPCPYDGAIWSASFNRGILNHNLCYIPYGFFSIGNDWTMNQIANNAALFNLYENELTYRQAAKMMMNGGRNVRVVGHTMADAFLSAEARQTPQWKDCGKPLKRVIWAPHWTLPSVNNWFHSSNFLQYADAMVQLARKYAEEIQFAFKPHPLLYTTLCSQEVWGKERTDEYYRLWAEMPNTQLETGSYAPLFMQSDAMVHDSSSFIIEYLFADKPAMFLREGEGYQGYTPLAVEALKCYHKGKTPEEIETFLQTCVMGDEDPYADARRDFRSRNLIPPHGVSAAQNVIDCLLGQGEYARD